MSHWKRTLVATIALAAGASGACGCGALVGVDFDQVHAGSQSGAFDATTFGDGSGFLPDGGSLPTIDAPFVSADGAPLTGEDGGPIVFVDSGPCTGAPTSISGVVYDPAGKSPIYDAIVYVPSQGLAALPTTVSCDRCGSAPSGAPFATALSDATGKFTLTGVPAGFNVPLVVQIGKWRRETTIPVVTGCAVNALTDPNLTRLPKSASEGTLPHIAISTGQGDAIECVLRDMGVADSEFTPPGGAGHVHLYTENGATFPNDAGLPASQLWSALSTLEKYDLVLFGCEAMLATKPAAALKNLTDYMGEGGRVFLQHYELPWFRDAPAPTSGVGDWSPDFSAGATASATVDTTLFPKGTAFADWLAATGASSTHGSLALANSRNDINVVHAPAQRWLSAPVSGGVNDAGVAVNASAALALSFNAPFGAGASAQCGRGLYADFHSDFAPQGLTFPSECTGLGLGGTSDTKALEYAIWDLAACIEPDSQTPQAPPTK